MMRVIRAADCRRMPWKNGGGSTTEIAVSPPGAGLDAFDWRVSMAEVATDGPFSAFPEIDRTLSVLEGGGIRLAVEGFPPVELRPGDRPHAFPGDVPAGAVLLEGPITDLNVMTRRGRFSHRVTRRELAGAATLAVGSPVTLLLCHRGWVSVAGFDLGPGDTLLAEAWAGDRASAAEPVALFLIELFPARE